MMVIRFFLANMCLKVASDGCSMSQCIVGASQVRHDELIDHHDEGQRDDSDHDDRSTLCPTLIRALGMSTNDNYYYYYYYYYY